MHSNKLSPKSQWVQRTKVYFLLTLHVHHSLVGDSTPHGQAGTLAGGGTTIVFLHHLKPSNLGLCGTTKMLENLESFTVFLTASTS